MTQSTPNPKASARSFLIAGLLPVVAFTVIEEYYGTLWGIIAGMAFGIGEILWEWKKFGKVSTITWAGNALILVLGGVSLVASEGIWFKLQPAFLEVAMGAFLLGSFLLKKPFMLQMAEKQNPQLPEVLKAALSAITFRLSLFFFAHAGLAVWAALHWSTSAWALLKGVGVIVSMFIYMGLEILWIRLKRKN